MYAVVDVETTGGSPAHERITEIAVFIFDGQNIVDEFSTLVNPEKNIPYHITRLTGITNEMVAEAPRFFEIARRLVEMTEGCIFVAHNVTFDYQFIRHEFLRLGYKYEREKLCTVKLSRKLLPGLRSYSLGEICREAGIQINDRHRAAGDALATVMLLRFLLSKGCNEDVINELTDISMKGLHPLFDRNVFRNLPEEPGVYYFLNEKGDVIYIGKSRNIRQRVIQHFTGTGQSGKLKMRGEVVSVTWEPTGSELVALLLESDEIKKHKPLYNRKQRRALSMYGIFHYLNDKGYICFSIERIRDVNALPLDTFALKAEATDVLNAWIDRYTLCQKLCGVYDSPGACFHYEIRECKGACLGIEPPETYNRRAELVIRQMQYQHHNMFIIDRGRHAEEKAVVKIENGRYAGFGFIDAECINGLESLHDCIKAYHDNHDVQWIIRSYLRKKKVGKIIEY
ncbi:MAG: exonuclease domain-containing protein [Bacteroidales bacterium]